MALAGLWLLLVGAKMLVPSFTIVWFGLAACLVGVLLLIAPGLPLALRAGDYARVTGIDGHVLNVEKLPTSS